MLDIGGVHASLLTFPAFVWAVSASWAAPCVVHVCSLFQPFWVGGARTLLAASSLHLANSISFSHKISIIHQHQPAVLFSYKKPAPAAAQFCLGTAYFLRHIGGVHSPAVLALIYRLEFLGCVAEQTRIFSFPSSVGSCSYLFLHSSLVTSEIC